MKPFFPLITFVFCISTWAEPARAQLSIPGFGYLSSGSTSTVRSSGGRGLSQQQQYAKPPSVGSRLSSSQKAPTTPNFADRFGRADLAGHGVGGYPIIRGDLEKSKVSRGGANGARHGRRR
jgi:hypothetical protein